METNNENIVMEENEINTVETVEEPISGEVVDSTTETTELSVPEKRNAILAKLAGAITIGGVAAMFVGGRKLCQKVKAKKQKKEEEKTEPAETEKKPTNKVKLTLKERVLGYVDVGVEPEEEPVTEE